MKTAYGYAYKAKDGTLDVATVQTDKIGVMVNYLVVHEKAMVMNDAPDWFIENLFHGKAEGTVVKVRIEEVE